MSAIGRHETGHIAVLTVGFMVLLGMLAVLVINSSDAFIQARGLDNLADGAAIAAADGLSEAALYDGGDLELSHRQASAAVVDYLGGQDVEVEAVRVDGPTVSVRLRRQVALRIRPPGWPRNATLTSTAHATLQDFGAFG